MPPIPSPSATARLATTRPGSYAQFGKLGSIDDVPETPPKALEMVAILVAGHEAVARTARRVFPLATRRTTSRPPIC